MKRRTLVLGSIFAGVGFSQAGRDIGSLKQAVAEAERGFAGAMAKRDHAAFSAFLADEAVFIGDPEAKQVLRGKAAVANGWKRFFDAPSAPFSWEPEVVEVLDSGGLALSTGPVRDPQGMLTARFTSIWRLERDGKWKVVFDRGCGECRCAA